MSSSIFLNLHPGSSKKEEIVTYSTENILVETVESNHMYYFFGVSTVNSFIKNLTDETIYRYIDFLYTAINNSKN